jgi:hypothetical protein
MLPAMAAWRKGSSVLGVLVCAMVGGREVGARPRWPDLVIVLAITALTVVGVAALFGSSIRGWFFPAAEAPAPARAGQRAL